MTQASFDLDDVGEPTYTVGELADAVNMVLRRGFRDGVWVRGEIEGYQRRGDHVYFSLAEHDGERRATVAVALFANVAWKLRPLLQRHRLKLRDGLCVRIHGRLDVYAATGKLSLLMDGLDPTFTLGQMAADRDQLLQRLAADGLLHRNKRVVVPRLPLHVGLVTASGSAAWHDLVHELRVSGLPFRLAHVDVRVQGATAPAEVAAAVRTLGRRGVDVIALVRGGGARNDLAAFDTEEVAVAIAASPVPVLTGLGHEIDRSVADEVAHTALKTPTACAAHLVARVRDVHDEVEQAWAALARRAVRRLERADTATRRLAELVVRDARAASQRSDARVRRAGQGVVRQARVATAPPWRRLDVDAARLGERAPAAAARAGRHLDVVAAQVSALDPARALERGWSITRTADGGIVRDPALVHPGDVLVTTLAAGTVRSVVTDPAGGAP